MCAAPDCDAYREDPGEETEMNLTTVNAGLGGGSVLQYANRDHWQSMGYFIKTPDGKTVVIDGGRFEGKDAEHLHSLIRDDGGRVDLWFITHAHEDHFGALSYILRNTVPLDIEIGELCFNFPPVEWTKTVEDAISYPHIVRFLAELEVCKINHRRVAQDEVIECGGLSVEVVFDGGGYEKRDNINDTSLVLRFHFPSRDILFLADLGWDGGDDLLKLVSHDRLRCDIVQLAHHGQNGVRRSFYEVVRPKLALYTAPLWLWENDCGSGRGSGPWKTLETRRWLDELGVEQSLPHAYGDFLIV